MSGLGRLLSKREKRGESPSTRHRLSMYLSGQNSTANKSAELIDPNSVADFLGLFFDNGKPNTAEEHKLKALRQRVIASKSVMVKDDNLLWSLRCNFSKGDADAAYDLLCAMTDASEGIVIPYNSHVKLLGAINRQSVTCFLDSVLFAMFSRLDSFEAMLYNTFSDRPRNRLAFLLRLWVNLLRAGKLITTDVTMNIQDTLAECGWKDAGKIRQQDASEAFTFITEKLQLPLLTLKMDMYHAGKQDADDHRFINERLLEVAIPAAEDGGHKDIKLEDCLEDYFNNRIEVRRFLERRSTLKSMSSEDSIAKSKAIHVETVELEDSDTALTPVTPRSSYVTSPRPGGNRSRATSIIQERFVPDSEPQKRTALNNNGVKELNGRPRNGSIRKEVLMPAWQFFSLIPWYTNNMPSNDAQVADHFSSKRPIIGLCLKRYCMTPAGRAIRKDTFIDIPVEIGLPHFIQDDKMDAMGPLYGNFKLSLQSVVCHRGNSVDSGHYISLVRTTSQSSGADADHWMRFDDLAAQKVTMIDVHQALRDETPYLLFYQIVPVEGDPGNLTLGENPPSYAESQQHTSDGGSPDFGRSTTNESEQLAPKPGSAGSVLSNSPEFGRWTSGSQPPSQPPSGRPSFDLPPIDDHRATIVPNEKRRPSTMVFTGPLTVGKSSRSSSQEQNRRKSASISRSISRGSMVISKSLGLGGGNRTKDERRASIAPEPMISVEEVGGTPEDALARLNGEIPAKLTLDPPETDHGRGRSQKRNKSKNRLSKVYAGRGKAEKPDRECVVM